MERFNNDLLTACDKAKSQGGFHLENFAAQRALGKALIMNIDPMQLRKFLDERILIDDEMVNITDRFIGGGDWSPVTVPLKEQFTHLEALTTARAKNYNYNKVRMYKRALNRCRNDRPIKRNFVALDTPEKVREYFDGLVELVRSIKEHGIISRHDYRATEQIQWKAKGLRHAWVENFESDIGVAISAGGRVLRFSSGKHRTGIAKGLRLKSIPVEVRMVHADWLTRQISRTGKPPAEALLNGLARLQKRARKKASDSP